MPEDKTTRRRELYSMLGDLPDRRKSVRWEKVSEERREKYVLEKLVLDLNGIEDVPAYFVRPTDAAKGGRLPVVLYNHAHGGDYALGKDELLKGSRFLQKSPYAEELTAKGYGALCIDHWVFGARSGRTESSVFKQMLWEGKVLWGMMVFDTLRALDYLLTRPDVDPTRVATLGLSMGSTMAWWAAALDGRIKVCVDLCCLTDFQALIDTGNLDGHGVYYYVPGLLKHFTTAQINALISPRPHLALAGNLDALTPPKGLDRVDAELKQAYAADGAAPGAWKLFRQDVKHQETPEMRAEVVEFLGQWL
jgi:dienelactone hydrolase